MTLLKLTNLFWTPSKKQQTQVVAPCKTLQEHHEGILDLAGARF